MTHAPSNSGTNAIRVKAADLPISCPTSQMPPWSAHPKVFLAFENNEVTCPYCGNHFILEPGP